MNWLLQHIPNDNFCNSTKYVISKQTPTIAAIFRPRLSSFAPPTSSPTPGCPVLVSGGCFWARRPCANPCAIFAISSCYVVSDFIISYSLESQQTIDKSKKNPEALISQSFGIWWRRGESNPPIKSSNRLCRNYKDYFVCKIVCNFSSK